MARPRILPEHDGDFVREFRHLGAVGMAAVYGVTEQAVYKAIKDRKLPGLVEPRQHGRWRRPRRWRRRTPALNGTMRSTP